MFLLMMIIQLSASVARKPRVKFEAQKESFHWL